MNYIRISRELTVDTFDQIDDRGVEHFLVCWVVRAEYVDEVTCFFPQGLESLDASHGLDERRVDPMQHNLQNRNISIEHSETSDERQR
jgi:hypothetical protein